MPKTSIFLSSPADVQPEREAAERVVRRLGGVYVTHVELALERWERRFYEATSGFQEAIAAMETFDVVVGVLWKRIGSELPPDRFIRPEDGTPYESGTAYELETALAAHRRFDRPSVYVFRKTASIAYAAERVDEERAQKEMLDRWWARTFRDDAGHHIAASNSFGTTEEFETKLEDCLVEWLTQKGYIPSGPVWDACANGSPYPGLLAYDRDRSPVFFGRQLAVEQAREELLAAMARDRGLSALFVIGASGSGKSSLVRAGLLPRLTQPGIVPGVDLWRTVIIAPVADSLAALAVRLYDGLPELAEGAQPDAARWAKVAAASPEAAADAIAWALDRVGKAERQRTGADRQLHARVVLVVDQLEQLFHTPGQRGFSRVLRAFAVDAQVCVLATLRSDRYAELQLDPDLLELKRRGAAYDLPPPGPAEIADIVRGPARAAGLILAERQGQSLARVLVGAVPNADALPLLQMTLAQLFEHRKGAELTFDAYEAMGGVDGAIAAHAETIFNQAPLVAQRELDPLVGGLVRDVGRRGDGGIRFVPQSVMRSAFGTSADRRHLVETLVDGRLLVSDGGNLRLAHEALLRRWSRASSILARIADAQLRKERFQTAVKTAAFIMSVLMVGVIVVLSFRYIKIEGENELNAAFAREGVTVIFNQDKSHSLVFSRSAKRGAWDRLASSLPRLHPVTSLVIAGDDDLKNLRLPSALSSVKNLHVTDNTNLRSIDLPHALNELQELRVSDNPALRALTLPERLGALQTFAVLNNLALSKLELPQGLPQLNLLQIQNNGEITFLNLRRHLPNLNTFYVRNNAKLLTVELPDDFPQLSDMRFLDNGALGKLELPRRLLNLKSIQIANNHKLLSLRLPESAPSLQLVEISRNPMLDVLKLQDDNYVLKFLAITANETLTTVDGWHRAKSLVAIALSGPLLRNLEASEIAALRNLRALLLPRDDDVAVGLSTRLAEQRRAQGHATIEVLYAYPLTSAWETNWRKLATVADLAGVIEKCRGTVYKARSIHAETRQLSLHDGRRIQVAIEYVVEAGFEPCESGDVRPIDHRTCTYYPAERRLIRTISIPSQSSTSTRRRVIELPFPEPMSYNGDCNGALETAFTNAHDDALGGKESWGKYIMDDQSRMLEDLSALSQEMVVK